MGGRKVVRTDTSWVKKKAVPRVARSAAVTVANLEAQQAASTAGWKAVSLADRKEVR